jgi:small GTP-binding protein
MSQVKAPTRFNIAVIGDSAVGKSALTTQYIQNIFTGEYDPAAVAQYTKRLLIDGETVTIDIVDISAHEENQAREQYLQNVDGCVLVFSLDSLSSFNEIGPTIEQVYQVKETTEVPMVLVGNKSDLCSKQIMKEDITQMMDKYSLIYIETSAKSRIHVDECFRALVLEIRKKARIRQQATSSSHQRCALV